MKKLNADKIGRSQEIAKWLDQFSMTHRPLAESMLLHLRFVSRDEYSNWFRTTVDSIDSASPLALFAVRKLEGQGGQVTAYFDYHGNPVVRPPQSLGSEDLVYSLISNIVRSDSSRFLDHPDLGRMRDEKVRHIVLIDDSIGSGDRVAGFLSSMMQSKTLLSWWSYGLIRFTIVSYARTREGEKMIVRSMVGSNHPNRKYPKSRKMHFESEWVYSGADMKSRWGSRYGDILYLCDSVTKVRRKFRRGYGEVMATVVFYHSVPNNIPGVFFYKSNGWNPLFPGRALPDWIISLLEEEEQCTDSDAWTGLATEMIELLALAKKGVRNRGVVAQRMGRAEDYIESLVSQAMRLGLVSEKGRITRAGMDAYYANIRQVKRRTYDYSLYIPSSWCAGRETVQPSECGGDSYPGISADLVDASSASGEAGQVSLEETDDKAAPICAELHRPAVSRENLGTDGSADLKE